MNAKPDTWMPFYVGDYLADTTHLASAEEHGAYLLLLMTCWKRGGSLPADDRQWQSIARLSAQRWKVLKPTLRAFFQPEADGTWSQKRISREFAKAQKNVEARSNAGAKGAQARWQTHADANGKPMANAIQTHGPPPSPPPIDINIKGVGGALRARGASRLDFSNPANRQAFARNKIGALIGWETMMAAEDPKAPSHEKAVELARAAARKERVSWTPPKAA